MNKVAMLNTSEREELFILTAQEMHLPEAMVEKDFWVCWTLHYLFHSCPWAQHLAFKGGTSLSKCFHLIERFSEDIDVILDWRLLGYHMDEPWIQRSRTKQDAFNKDANARTEAFLRKTFLPQQQEDFSRLSIHDFSLYIDDADPQTICFSYPRIFSENAIVSVIRMEIGSLAAWTPVQNADVTSYAAQRYPQIFATPSIQILTVAPERTFWEKATILHKEAFRTNGKVPPRYSRHYYDLYRMDQSAVKMRAFADLQMLKRVVDFKDRFYHAGSAHYELAQPGTMRLMPPADCTPILRDDYEHMKNMIFGHLPNFEDIMDCTQRLELEINGLRSGN
jgi:predicted nucleotidyltransferase component of viral defense system